MRFEKTLGLRYLRSLRKKTFFSLVTWISVAGIALGVASLIVVMSVMSGFQAELKRVLTGMNAHVLIRQRTGAFFSPEEVEGYLRPLQEEWKRLAPILYTEGMLVGEGGVAGVAIEGTLPQVLQTSDLLRRGLVEGSLAPERPGDLIIGWRLAERLQAKVGSELRLIHGVEGKGGVFGQELTALRVAGIYRSGMYDFDAKVAFLSLSDARNFFGMPGRINAIKIWLPDVDKAPAVAEALSRSLPERFGAYDWLTVNRSIFDVIAMEKVVLALILLCIVLVAASNLIGSLIMIVVRKRGEIAILKAMGAGGRQLVGIFLVKGFMMGLLGTSIGVFIGLLLSLLIPYVHLISLPADIYFFSSLPAKVSLRDVALVSFVSLLISFLATLYPSWRASRVWPVEGLKEVS